MRYLIIFISSITFTLFSGTHQLDQKVLNWMYEQREANANQYREKDLTYFRFTQQNPARYQPVFVDQNNEFVLPNLRNNIQQINYNNNLKPLCRSRTFVKDTENEHVYKSLHDLLSDNIRGRTYVNVLLTPRATSEYEVFKKDKSINICNMTMIPTVVDKPKPKKKSSGRFMPAKFKQHKTETEPMRYYDGKLTCRPFEVGYGIISQPASTAPLQRDQKTYADIEFMRKLYDVCYNEEFNTPLYTHHKIYYKGLLNRKLNDGLNDISIPHVNRVHPSLPDIFDMYTQKGNYETNNSSMTQTELKAKGITTQHIEAGHAVVLDRRRVVQFVEDQQPLKSTYKANYDTHGNILVPVRLVPAYDMIYESWQYATNGYVNFSAQWRSVNLSSWLDIEEQVRHIAYMTKSDIDVYTGLGFDPNLNQKLGKILITKERRQVPIPDFYFKYIINSMNQGIVLIAMNNNTLEYPCSDICGRYLWPFGNQSYKIHRIMEGRTACCAPNEFFNRMPYDFDGPIVEQILPFPKINSGASSSTQGYTQVFSVPPLSNKSVKTRIWGYAIE